MPILRKLLIQVSDGCELPDVGRISGRRRATQEGEIARMEEVGGSNDGGAHGTVFVRPLSPGQLTVAPQVKSHTSPLLYYA